MSSFWPSQVAPDICHNHLIGTSAEVPVIVYQACKWSSLTNMFCFSSFFLCCCCCVCVFFFVFCFLIHWVPPGRTISQWVCTEMCSQNIPSPYKISNQFFNWQLGTTVAWCIVQKVHLSDLDVLFLLSNRFLKFPQDLKYSCNHLCEPKHSKIQLMTWYCEVIISVSTKSYHRFHFRSFDLYYKQGVQRRFKSVWAA